MAVKIWNFLLPSGPAAGPHQVRVEKLGSAQQAVTLDGELCDVAQHGKGGEVKFEGLEGGQFELRKSGRRWLLYMDGNIIEDYEPHRRVNGDESLRELKGRPDGSYLLQTVIDASALNLNIVKKFRFVAYSVIHMVELAHSDCIWQVVLDGKVVERVVHLLSDAHGKADFTLHCGKGRILKAVAEMSWEKRQAGWNYTLTVNGLMVNHHWAKSSGEVKPATEPIDVTSKTGSISEFLEAKIEPCLPERLPQGVSFDPSTKRYQANIRMKSGKFMFLGDFSTSEEAHKRYLEVVPIHYPEKAVLPMSSLVTNSAKPQTSAPLPQVSPPRSARGAPSTPRKNGGSTLGMAGMALLTGAPGGIPGSDSPVRTGAEKNGKFNPMTPRGNGGGLMGDLTSPFGDSRSYLQKASTLKMNETVY